MAAIKRIIYKPITENGLSYWIVLAALAALSGIGLMAAYYMEHHGHYVTGMNNHIVWGLPHVFAVFLVVAASGALNVASVGSVFGKSDYKPLARLSGLLAIALLVGGLCVLVLDLGRPDRLIVAMTKFNFKSIFAWNVILYVGFIAVVGVYLMTMFQKSWGKYSKAAGTFAFVWRFILTTGTGSIFGFLVARHAYDAAIMAPLFISASLAFGTAIYILVLMWIYKSAGRPLGDGVIYRLKRLNAVLVVATLFFVIVYHISNLYATQHHGVEGYILAGGSVYSTVFWLGQMLIGTAIPLVLFWSDRFNTRVWTIVGAIAIILGGLAMMYVIIIGGQSYPMDLISGMQVSSSFDDGVATQYSPTLAEFLLGLGGLSFAILATLFAVKIMPFLPDSLADSSTD